MNIIVVSLNDQIAKNCAKELSQKLKFSFVDAGEQFENFLIASADNPLLIVDEELKNLESKIVKEVSKKRNSVVAMPNDMFLSDAHYNLLKKSKIVLVEAQNLTKTLKNVENLIKTNSNYVVNADFTLLALAEMLKKTF